MTAMECCTLSRCTELFWNPKGGSLQWPLYRSDRDRPEYCSWPVWAYIGPMCSHADCTLP